MPKCDLCNKSVKGAAVNSAQLRLAMLEKGLNTFAIGLYEGLMNKYRQMVLSEDMSYAAFKAV